MNQVMDRNHNKIVIMQLDQDEVVNILSKPVHSLSLVERLRSAYPATIRKNKTKRRTSKRRSSRRKSLK